MALKKETKEINGKSYLCIQWDAEKAYLMKFRILKVLGSSLTHLIEAISVKDENVQLEILSKSMNDLFLTNKPEEILELLKEVVCSCIVDGERMSTSKFASDFAGDLKTPYKIFAFVLKVNYSDFLGGSVTVSKMMDRVL